MAAAAIPMAAAATMAAAAAVAAAAALSVAHKLLSVAYKLLSVAYKLPSDARTNASKFYVQTSVRRTHKRSFIVCLRAIMSRWLDAPAPEGGARRAPQVVGPDPPICTDPQAWPRHSARSLPTYCAAGPGGPAPQHS